MNFLKSYKKNIVSYDLINKFFYNKVNNLPKIKQVNLYFVFTTSNLNSLLTALGGLELVSQQKGILLKSKINNVSIKIKKGNPVGCLVSLHNAKKEKFLIKLINDVLSNNSNIHHDKSFNQPTLSFKLATTLLIPELKQNYRFFNNLPNLHVNIMTTAKTKEEFKFLIKSYKIIS